MKLLLKDTEYEVTINNPVKDVFSEELDSATVIIAHLSSEISNLCVLDECILFDDNLNLPMCVADWNKTEINPKNKEFKYEIQLVSQTKKLEGIILPNLSITKISQPRDIIYYIVQYLNEYGEKIRQNNALTNKWVLDENNPDLDWSVFDTACPEMQWNRPTLREVITDLMMVVDCIPTLKNNKIGFIDLSKRGNAISEDDTHINYIQSNQSVSDYVSEIEMELQNVLQSKEDNVNNYMNLTEYIGFRSMEDYAISTNNVLLETKNPIYKISHLWVCLVVNSQWQTSSGDTSGKRLIEFDLCNLKDSPDGQSYNLVKEEKEYSVLPVLYQTAFTGTTFASMVPWQNYNIVYKRGEKAISNFYKTNKVFWFLSKSWLEAFVPIASIQLGAYGGPVLMDNILSIIE